MSRELLAGTTRSQRFSFGQKMDGQPERWGETWGGYGGDEGRGKRMFEKEASKRLRKHSALGSRMALERASVWAGLGWSVDAGGWQTLGQSETETWLRSRGEKSQWKWIAGKQWKLCEDLWLLVRTFWDKKDAGVS